MSSLSVQAKARRMPWNRIGLAVVLLTIAVPARDHLVDAALFALSNLWQLAPIALVGLVMTAALTATGSLRLLVDMFDNRVLTAIVVISLIGAILPVCGITLLPLVAGLLSAGVSLAPVMAFLLSSAVTDPELIAVTVAVLGVPFAAGKTVAALGIGLAGGGTTLMLMRLGWFAEPARATPAFRSLMPDSACGESQTVRWRFWQDPDRVTQFRRSCRTLSRLLVLWLSAAFVAEYFLRLHVPADSLATYVGGGNAFAVPVAAIVGTPLYLDGFAALPLVRGLMDLGMAPGAAMAFILAGSITSAWTAIPVFALFRLPVFLTYIIMAVFGAMLSGWAYGLAVA